MDGAFIVSPCLSPNVIIAATGFSLQPTYFLQLASTWTGSLRITQLIDNMKCLSGCDFLLHFLGVITYYFVLSVYHPSLE